MPPALDELRKWVNDKYGIYVINVVYDKIDIGPHRERARVNLIVETHDDYSKMHEKPFISNEGYQKAIAERFAKIVKNAGLEENYDTDDIFVIYDDFSDEAMRRASIHLLDNHQKQLMSKFSDLKIWKIRQSDFSKLIVVFYYKDNDITENDKNGNSEHVKRECYQLIKQYDEFNYIQFDTLPVIFDSKQNLDENYQGNFYYYFH